MTCAFSISRSSRAIFEFQILIYLPEMNNNLLINLQNMYRQQWEAAWIFELCKRTMAVSQHTFI